MAAERLSIRKIREVLRLHASGLSHREIGVGACRSDGVVAVFFLSTDRVGDRELEEAVRDAFPGGEGQRIMASVTNRWIQQGLQEGMEQGMQRGAVAKAREYVLEVLGTRFHSVPETLRARIERLEDLTTLNRFLKKALTATSLEDFGRDLEEARS